MKTLKTIATILIILFIAAQFVRPDRTNPPVDPQQDVHAAAQVPPEVSAILKRSCFDCHSNETVWPWYSNITPVNWWMVKSHVEHARGHYNFSTWAAIPAKDQDHVLDEICEEVEAGAMPLPSYLILHGDARLSEQDKQAICAWTKAGRQRLAAPATPETSAEAPGPGDHKH